MRNERKGRIHPLRNIFFMLFAMFSLISLACESTNIGRMIVNPSLVNSTPTPGGLNVPGAIQTVNSFPLPWVKTPTPSAP